MAEKVKSVNELIYYIRNNYNDKQMKEIIISVNFLIDDSQITDSILLLLLRKCKSTYSADFSKLEHSVLNSAIELLNSYKP